MQEQAPPTDNLTLLNNRTESESWASDWRVKTALEACYGLGVKSVYVWGSVARGTSGPRSDLDLIIVTRFPAYLHRFGRLSKLSRYNIDVKLLSTWLIFKVNHGISSSFIPQLGELKRDGILVFGKETRPLVLPSMDRHAFALYAFHSAAIFVPQFEASSGSIVFRDPEGSKRSILKNSTYFMKHIGVPPGWHEFGAGLRDRARSGIGPEDLCLTLADMLEPRLRDLRFTYRDQFHYAMIKLLTQRRVALGAFLHRPPIQERYLRALFLLYKSGGGERAKIFDATDLVGLRLPPSGAEDFCKAWAMVQETIHDEYEVMMGFGEYRNMFRGRSIIEYGPRDSRELKQVSRSA